MQAGLREVAKKCLEAGRLTLHLLPRNRPFFFVAEQQQMSATFAFERELDEGVSDRALRTRQHVRRGMRVGLVCCRISHRRSCRRQQEREAQHQAHCRTWLCGWWVTQGIELWVEQVSSIEGLKSRGRRVVAVERGGRSGIGRDEMGVAGRQ